MATKIAWFPPRHAARLARAVGPTTQLWLVPGAAHVGSFRLDSVGYLGRVENFLNNALRD